MIGEGITDEGLKDLFEAVDKTSADSGRMS